MHFYSSVFFFLCPWFMCFLASKIIWKTSVYWECRPNTGWPTFLGNLISNRIMKTHNKKCHDYYLNDEIRSFYTLFHDLNPDNWCILIESGGQSWNIRQTKWEQFWLALTSIFGLCFMLVCLIKSNCYSLIYSSLIEWLQRISPTYGLCVWFGYALVRSRGGHKRRAYILHHILICNTLAPLYKSLHPGIVCRKKCRNDPP